MALRAEEAEAAFIQSVCSRVRDDLAPELVDQCDAFVRQFYHWVPREDLAERSTHDLYGAAIAVWELARDRAPRAFNVRAYNPVLAEHGWRSTNTIVDVATDHMPFLVDSVGMELSRRGYGIQLSIHPVIDVLRDAHGRLVEVLPAGARLPGVLTEPLMQFEIDRETQPERLEELVGGIRRVLADVMVAVEDWPIMRRRMHEIADAFVVPAPPLHRREVEEVNAFLEWVDGGNFIFQPASPSGADYLICRPRPGVTTIPRSSPRAAVSTPDLRSGFRCRQTCARRSTSTRTRSPPMS